MKKLITSIFFVMLSSSLLFAQQNNDNAPIVKTLNGKLEGINVSGVAEFKGVPFAAPPVGEFRWREPEPLKNWNGIRKADKFGPRAM